MAAASCAAELRKRGAEGSILLVGREPEPPYERPPISKEYLRGEAERADAYVNPPSWYEENGVELLTGRNVMSLDPGGAHGEDPGRGGGRLRQGADRHRGDGQHPPRRGRRERGHPLPARLRQLRRDPRRRRGGRARGPDRRQLHRHRGRRLADREGHQVLDRGDGGGGALAHLRRPTPAAGSRSSSKPTASSSTAARSSRPSRATAGSARSLTKSGLSIECDTVVVGAGVRPDAMLAAAGRARGRRRDRLRLEAADLGRGHLRRRRLLLLRERRPRPPDPGRALGRGDAAGHARRRATCSATTRDYEVVPYFFSDLADWASLEYVGPAQDWDEEIWRGDRDGRRVLGLVPEGRPRRRRAQRRPLRRPRRSPPDARRRSRRLARRSRCGETHFTSRRSPARQRRPEDLPELGDLPTVDAVASDRRRRQRPLGDRLDILAQSLCALV